MMQIGLQGNRDEVRVTPVASAIAGPICLGQVHKEKGPPLWGGPRNPAMSAGSELDARTDHDGRQVFAGDHALTEISLGVPEGCLRIKLHGGAVNLLNDT